MPESALAQPLSEDEVDNELLERRRAAAALQKTGKDQGAATAADKGAPKAQLAAELSDIDS